MTISNIHRHLSVEETRRRDRTQETAQRLSLLAMRHWERALAGVLAVPAATAISTGAALLFAVSIFEKTFGLFDETVARVGARIEGGFAAAFDDVAGEPLDGSAAPLREEVGARASSGRTRTGVAARAGARRRPPPIGAATPPDAGAGASRVARPGVGGAAAEPATTSIATGAGAAPAGTASNVAERAPKTDDAWDVVLVDAGADPIVLIRELRAFTGRDLRDLETLIASVPDVVSCDVPRVDAESLRGCIEAAGGRVEVRSGSARTSNA